MTSAEWDLRALKALEQEQEKQKKQQQQHLKKTSYLALSQRSLYDPSSSLPITPPSLKKQLVKQLPTANTQHFIHTALKERSDVGPLIAVPPPPPPGTASGSNSSSSNNSSSNYMQLQAQQLLKLPTISEHQQQYLLAQKKKTNNNGNKDSSGGGSGKLKFSKVLSLSAQSLTNRLGSKKSKNKTGASPGHYVASSPMYTPPPTRRCNTLHHTPQVRKTFKTLQELERRKLEARPGELQITRTLHRIAGTHKTYWKYGINSTANSIVGQHQQKQQQQHNLQQQHQQKRHLQQSRSLNSELESYTSDELDSEENNSSQLKENLLGTPKHVAQERIPTPTKPAAVAAAEEQDEEEPATDFDDTATEVGSCTVPLASDSIEMMNLMLSAAQSAVITQPSITSFNPSKLPPTLIGESSQPPPPPDLTAINSNDSMRDSRATTLTATGGATVSADVSKYFTLGHAQRQQHQQHSFSRYSDNEDYGCSPPPNHQPSFLAGSYLPHNFAEETVAYKALQQLARRKSFSGEKMRAHSLQRNVSLSSYSYDNDDGGQQSSGENDNDSDQQQEEDVDNVAADDDDEVIKNSNTLNIASTVSRSNSTRRQSRSYVNNRSLLKASSLDVPPSALVYTTDFNIPNSTTIITNPLMAPHMKATNTSHPHPAPPTINLLKSSKTLKTSAQIKQKLLKSSNLLAATNANTKSSSSSSSQFNDLNTAVSSRLLRSTAQLQQLSPANMVATTRDASGGGGGDEGLSYHPPQHLHLNFHQHLTLNGSQQQQLQHHLHNQHPHHHGSALSPDIFDNTCANNDLCAAAMSSLIIDDELEQHIKQCSCSCNHMGYGNSMDYQVSERATDMYLIEIR
ncbi:uncharacterized protein [Musca autumnalis]|uniref:uncharacterized protein n=1 Tax=Musca autumnalis TaxID=221902 RepID=UPI003CEDFB6A